GVVAEYERLTALVDSARGDDAGIEERARRLGAEAELLRAAAEALAERDRAVEELRAAEVEADWYLAELDLSGRSTDPPPGATEAEVHAATLDEREREALREQARAHDRSEEHTSELQSRFDLVCRLLLEKKNKERIR